MNVEIRTVTINGFKCFRGSRTLSLTKGLNCLQGSNGAGKTSSVEAICCLFGINRHETLRYSNLHELINHESLALDANAAASLAMTVQYTKTHHHQQQQLTASIECTISAKSMAYRLNGKNISHRNLKAFLRTTFGFEQPCFFIQQSKATSLASCQPVVLWKYLQETTGERLVCTVEDQWRKTQLAVKAKYCTVIEYINDLKGSRDKVLHFVRATQQYQQLCTDLRQTVSKKQKLSHQIVGRQHADAKATLARIERQLRENDVADQYASGQFEAAQQISQQLSLRKAQLLTKHQESTRAVFTLQAQISTCETVVASMQNEAHQVQQQAAHDEKLSEQLYQSLAKKEAELAKVQSKIDYFTKHCATAAAAQSRQGQGHNSAVAEVQKQQNLQHKIAGLERAVKDAARQHQLAVHELQSVQRCWMGHRESLEITSSQLQEKLVALRMSRQNASSRSVAKLLVSEERKCNGILQRIDSLNEQLRSPRFQFINKAQLQADTIRRKLKLGSVQPNTSTSSAIRRTQFQDSSNDRYLGPICLALRAKPSAGKKYMTALAHFLEPVWEVHVANGLDIAERVSRVSAQIARLWNTNKFVTHQHGSSVLSTHVPAAVPAIDPRTLLLYPEHLRSVVDHIFGGVLIADSDEASAILLKRYNIPSVTVDGNVSRVGEYVGGHSNSSASSQSRTASVFAYQSLGAQASTLEQELDVHKASCASLSTLLALLRQQGKRRQMCEENRVQTTSCIDKETKLRVQLAQLQGTLDACIRHHSAVVATASRGVDHEGDAISVALSAKKALQGLTVKRRQIKLELERLAHRVATLNNKSCSREEQSGDEDDIANDDVTEDTTLQARLQKQQLKIQEFTVQHQHAKHTLNEVVAEEVRVQSKIAEQADIEELLQSEMRSIRDVSNKLRKQSVKLKQEIAELQRQVGTAHTDASSAPGHDDDIDDDGGSQPAAATSTSMPLSQMVQYVRDLTRLETSLRTDVDDVERQLVGLRKEFGNVDPASCMADVERLDSHLTQLQEQVDTIRVAMQCLEAQIQATRTSLTQDTKRAFTVLQKNFKKIAHALLPSYTLNLVPVHDNEVVANPQASAVNGLKFEVNGVVDGSTAEFSGGQKTMLGVAFLVALASLRNFPVYLMDELDAALDPENQKRCATLIRNVSQNAQVVVVSHNVSFQNQADTRVNI